MTAIDLFDNRTTSANGGWGTASSGPAWALPGFGYATGTNVDAGRGGIMGSSLASCGFNGSTTPAQVLAGPLAELGNVFSVVIEFDLANISSVVGPGIMNQQIWFGDSGTPNILVVGIGISAPSNFYAVDSLGGGGISTASWPVAPADGTLYKIRIARTTTTDEITLWASSDSEPAPQITVAATDYPLTQMLFQQARIGIPGTFSSFGFRSIGADAPVVDMSVAWDVYEVGAPGDTLTFIGTLSDAEQRAIKPIRNAPGSGQFAINRNSANAALVVGGNLVKCRYPQIHSDYIFAFWIDDETTTLVSTDEEGGETIACTGSGALQYLDRAIWLSKKYAIDWWPGSMSTPPAGAEGAVLVNAGTYRSYTLDGSFNITGYSMITVSAFNAFFDSKLIYQWPAANGQRFLVKIMAGEPHAGVWFSPYQDGVLEVMPGYDFNMTIHLSQLDDPILNALGGPISGAGAGPGTKPGKVLARMLAEAQAAGRPAHPLPLLTYDFDETVDSNGDAWTTTDALAGLTAQRGENYMTTLATLLGTGVLDVEMGPNLDLHAYNAQGRDLTGTSFGTGVVRFARGVNIADALTRERLNRTIATWTEVSDIQSGGFNAAPAQLADHASRVTREIGATGTTQVVASLSAIGLADLNGQLVRSDAVGFRTVAIEDAELVGHYLFGPPGSDHGKYWLGDLVTLHTGTGNEDFDEVSLVVAAGTIAEDDAGNLEITPELSSPLGEAERRLFALRGGGGGGGSVPSTSVGGGLTDGGTGVSGDALLAHETDATDAHDASAIGFTPAAGIAATDVQGAIVEDAGDLSAHLADPTAAHAASAIGFTPTGTISSTDVQAAIAEVAAEAGGAAITWNETPGGTVNGVNATFTLAAAPAGGALLLYKNGLLQRAGAGNDYTLASSTVTFLAGNLPQTGDILLATYPT